VGPSTATHRTSRFEPRTRRAAQLAITPSRVNGKFPCETVFELMKDPPRDHAFVSPILGDSPPAVKRETTSADVSATEIRVSILGRPVLSRATQGVT